MAHTATYDSQVSLIAPVHGRTGFFEASPEWAMAVAVNKGTVIFMSPEELNTNIIAVKQAGYVLHSVKNVLNKPCVLAIYQHPCGERVDPLAGVFSVASKGYSFAVKKQCLVCHQNTNYACSKCRVAHYCSYRCQQSDSQNHQQWCSWPKYDVEAFQQGIDKIRETVYKHKVYNSMFERWITPRPDGTCGYAEWSWKKMQEECGF